MHAYIDGRFSVPENPVMRGLNGFGLLQAGNGQAFGQSVDLPSAMPPSAFYSGGDVTSNPNGPGWASSRNDGTIWTASYCDKIIGGGAGSDVDKFQCSIRGYVGNQPALSIPPALIPAPPTSVTVPQAATRPTTPMPVSRPAPLSKCAAGDDSGPGMNECLMLLAAFAVGYFLTSAGGGNQ